MKMTTGIPRSQLVIVEDRDIPGAMLNPDGTFAVFKTKYEKNKHVHFSYVAQPTPQESASCPDRPCCVRSTTRAQMPYLLEADDRCRDRTVLRQKLL